LLPLGDRRVGGARRIQRAVEIADTDGVDLAVVFFDAVHRGLRQFNGGDGLGRERGGGLGCGLEGELRCCHGNSSR
jgi:hypothetical protein